MKNTFYYCYQIFTSALSFVIFALAVWLPLQIYFWLKYGSFRYLDACNFLGYKFCNIRTEYIGWNKISNWMLSNDFMYVTSLICIPTMLICWLVMIRIDKHLYKEGAANEQK